MDNQHRLIKGYKELTARQIDDMNKVKELGKQIQDLVEYLRYAKHDDALEPVDGIEIPATLAYDQRWISIGVTHLQQGLMALTRGITKPDFF